MRWVYLLTISQKNYILAEYLIPKDGGHVQQLLKFDFDYCEY